MSEEKEALESLDRLNKEMWFLTGVSNAYMPENMSVNARIMALLKNHQELENHVNTLRTHILDLDRRLRLKEERKKKWWNR